MPLKNRARTTLTLHKKTLELLREMSEETGIPMTKLVDRAVGETYVVGRKKTEERREDEC